MKNYLINNSVSILLILLSFLGITQFDKLSSYFKNQLNIYLISERTIKYEDKEFILSKLKIGNDFTTKDINTNNLKNKINFDYSKDKDNINLFFISDLDNVNVEFTNNEKDGKIYFDIKKLGYDDFFILNILSNKSLNIGEWLFNANLVGIDVNPNIIQSKSNLIEEYKYILSLLVFLIIFGYREFKNKSLLNEYKVKYNHKNTENISLKKIESEYSKLKGKYQESNMHITNYKNEFKEKEMLLIEENEKLKSKNYRLEVQVEVLKISKDKGEKNV